MADIVLAPAPVLETACDEVEPDSALAHQIAADLVLAIQGIPYAAAIAANQLGWPYRMLIKRARGSQANAEYGDILVNPRIVKTSKGDRPGWEGCLSFPGVEFHVPRPTKVVVSAHSLEGERLHVVGHGFDARVYCHEIDHLDGVYASERATAQRSVRQR